MAGLFLCAWHFLGDYLGYLDCLDSIWGVNLGFLRFLRFLFFLCFHLSSIWDSILDPILDPLVSILELLPDGSGKVFLSTSDTQIVQT